MIRSCTILLLFAMSANAAPPKASAFFENRIRPILIDRCYECHSEKAGKQKGGLWLDRSAGWLQGGESGPAVVPHNIKKSLLAHAVNGDDADFAMPPDDPLPEEEVALLLRWISIGAPGPRKEKAGDFVRLGDQEALAEKAESHWSFQPITKPNVPDDNAIDRLIRRKLPEGMRLAPPADKRTLIRRLYYDLTGLPPSYEEVQEFANSADPKAVEKLVDELLASPRFGERWGRYWLDIARYADTREWQAAGRDSRYPFAYTYRDYVIRSFNADKPYDEFLREQIAADSYVDKNAPELAALGFLTVGSRYRNNRDEIYNDRIDVVTRGIMGLTVACARCHDHKYDPIPTTDYYALKGVFASSSDPQEYPTITAYKRQEQEVANYAKAFGKAKAELDAYQQGLADDAMADFREKPEAYMGALHDIYVSQKDNVRKLITGNKFKETALTPLTRTLPRVVSANGLYRKDPIWRPWNLFMHLPNAELAKAVAKFATEDDALTDPFVKAELARAPLPKTRRAFMQRYGQILAKGDEQKQERILAAFTDKKSPLYITAPAATGASQLLGKGRTTLARYRGALTDIDAEHPGAPARAMVLADIARPVDVPVYERGDAQRKGDLVPRRFLQVLGGQALKDGSGRRQLAEAITAPDNPFPARVHANRVWSHLFGQSLVDTPGDFGLQAPKPLQLDLLDWLADSLRQENWSTKSLARKIVLSKTYQASSDVKSAADPENRYLARANVRRLDFEAMRDSILAGSGQLDLTEGGRAVDITVAPYSPRRTVYAYVDRMNIDDMFSTFDFPSPNVSSPVRPQTMVPQQALFSMNDPFTMAQARALAASSELRAGKNAIEKLTFLYRRLYQRDPKPFELKMGAGFLASAIQSVALKPSPWSYGYGPADPAISADERFTPFPFYDPKRKSYQFSKAIPHPKRGFVRLLADGGNPGPRDPAIRRWTAPMDGDFRISGTLRRPSPKADSIRGRIIHSRHGMLGEWEVQPEGEASTAVAMVSVKAGDTIDFIVDCVGNASNDNFRWPTSLSLITPAEMMPSGAKTVWDTQADFAGPPPRQLRPWEQLAHALLMTNEFLFVD